MIYRSIWVALLVFVAGCGSSPKANFYTLGAEPAAGTSGQAAYSVVVGAVSVPEMLERPQIVTRGGANQVTINEFERWGSPLKSEIAQAVAANLTRMLAGAGVFIHPQSGAAVSDYRVLIDVQRFDSVPGDAATIEATWQVRPLKGESRSGRTVVRERVDGPGYPALVAAHSRALQVISRDIAAAIRPGATAK